MASDHQPVNDQHPHDRRSFLKLFTHFLGGVFSVIIGIPSVCYLIDPRNRGGSSKNEKRPVEGILVDKLELNKPVQGVIRDVRRDAWTLHPNDVIGRVWVIKTGPRPNDINVFTTICPHLGCSINHTEACFTCPCHGATFQLDGTKLGENSPSPRSMDSLVFEVVNNELRVEYKNFYQGGEEKREKV